MIIKINRRDFLKTAAGLTAFSLGLNASSPPIFKRRILAADPGQNNGNILIFIFKRGGSDGINEVIPRHDSQYNPTNRPTLFIPEANGIDLPGSTTQLHPRLLPLMDLYNTGQIALLHRIGYKGQSQSHFDSQQYWENGMVGDNKNEEGIFNRQVQQTFAKQGHPFPAVGLSSSQLVALKGPEPIPNFSSVQSYTLTGTPAQKNKFIGRAGGPGLSPRGLLGFYGGAQDFPGKPNRDEAYRTGLVLFDSMNRVGSLNPDNYFPANNAQYPNSTFGTKLKQIAQMIKELGTGDTPPPQIYGVNIGGWDTHTNQAAAHNDLLNQLGGGINALSKDLAALWDRVVVMTMSEFGRTSLENGSKGTDHAYASTLFVAGGKVKGGVYNCDPITWPDGAMLSSSSGRYLPHKTDFRCVIEEILRVHFGDTSEVINNVIPGYDGLKNAAPLDFAPLGFMKTV